MEDMPREGLDGPLQAEAPGQRGEAGASGRPRPAWLLWGALCLLCLLVVIQGAGVLLRDRVEGRVAVGAAPPPREEAAAPEARAGPFGLPAGARFPPPVREVVVASGAPPGFSAAAPAPATPAAVATAASREAAPPTPPPGPAASAVLPAAAVPEATQEAPPPPPPAPAPARPGTHVLQMGVFRSQKYRRETEQRLDALGIPHYRVEGAAKGDSFLLAVPAGDGDTRDRARAALDRAGYLYRETPEGVEIRFFLEEEARQALEAVTRAGLTGAGYLRVPGEMPLWTVLAGPFSEQEARAQRERLAREGLDSYLRRRP